jgi:multidrug resistance efflux pump
MCNSRATSGRTAADHVTRLPPRATLECVMHGCHLMAAVMLALFGAYRLELDDAFWAGITAAAACQPSLCRSLQKGRVRVVGIVVRAVAIVLLTAAVRRVQLSTLYTSIEKQRRFLSQAKTVAATYKSDWANVAQTRIELARTHIVALVNGYITSLQIQVGNCATIGQWALAWLDTGIFWVDGYFEETQLSRIHIGDQARSTLMGFRQLLESHVASGVQLVSAQSGWTSLAAINTVYTWIHLALRVPVRIETDHVPSGVTLVAGSTATVLIEFGTRTWRE